MLKMLLTGASGKPYSVQDIRKLQRDLKAIEPKLRTQFVREIKKIGKEPQNCLLYTSPSPRDS